jgi:hypothetical protein
MHEERNPRETFHAWDVRLDDLRRSCVENVEMQLYNVIEDRAAARSRESPWEDVFAFTCPADNYFRIQEPEATDCSERGEMSQMMSKFPFSVDVRQSEQNDATW